MNRRLILAALLAAAPAPALAQSARDNINALIDQHAKASGVPASFIHAVIKRESNYNPQAKGGSALGLMQIKHATARGMGYTGDASGLYDPATNLRFGVAYLAGAYRTAKGDLTQAYTYYNRGYYYAAKRQGVSTAVASVVAPVAASASAVANLFTGGGSVDPNVVTANTALAYAPTAAGSTVEAVEVPLPPRRPGSLSGAEMIQLASLDVAPALRTSMPASQAASVEVQATQAVEVPLPPRRPSAQTLAALARPVAVARKTPAPDTTREASALPVDQ